MPDLFILVDYRDAFCANQTTIHHNASMNVDRMVDCFAACGLRAQVRRFSEVASPLEMRGKPVIYTSSEDSGLLYKSYIEDCVLALAEAGAHVLPRYALLRAHHNKTAMEAQRHVWFPAEAAMLGTRVFGTFEELAQTTLDGPWPKVVKTAFGAGSAGVQLARTRAELLVLARRLSRSRVPLDEIAREHGKRLLRRGWHPRSLHREKFIVQNLIPGLAGDIKVLCFGDRFYPLYRWNRPNDFRASGGGRLQFDLPPEIDLASLFGYCDGIYRSLACPVLSLDIAFAQGAFFVIEFQALHFGTVTAERATGFYSRSRGWTFQVEEPDIERIYCEAVAEFLQPGRPQ